VPWRRLPWRSRLAFGLAGDERAAPDLDVLAAGIETSLAERRELAA
jgi:hypothetical protein